MLPVTFLSDYGLADEFVGVVHGVIARLAPRSRVIDVGHGVRPQDVRGGALMLARALPYLPAGVHLAVVDPGVGGPRRAIAARTAREGRLLVGPDNGLLAPAADAFGGVREAVEISASPWRLEPVSATFHGRDVFAPVAAGLAAGRRLADAGVRLDPAGLARLDVPAARRERGTLVAPILDCDGYGNVILAGSREDLAAAGLAPGAPITIETPGGAHAGRAGRTFGDVAPGELVLYEDAGGSAAVAVNGGSAAAFLAVRPGDELRIGRLRAATSGEGEGERDGDDRTVPGPRAR